MAKYRVTMPDGKKYEIAAPDDMDQQEVIAYALSTFGEDPQQPERPNPFGQPDLMNVNPFDVPTGQLAAPQRGGVSQDPAVLGVPMSQLPQIEPSPTTTMMDRVQAIPGVRALGGAVRGAYGVGQVASEVVGSAAESVGFDRSGADQLRDEFTNRLAALDTESARGLTRTRNPLDPVPLVLPEDWQEPYQNANVAGMVGMAAPFAVASPAVGVGGGLLGAGGRIAYAGGTGALAGYFTPQEDGVSLDQAESNAIVGLLVGAGVGGLVEVGLGIREIIQRLGKSRAGQAILDTVEPGKLEAVIEQMHTARPSIPGYAPTAEQAAVAADQPNLAGLGRSSRRFAPNEALQQADAQRLAQGEQLGRVNVATAVDGGASPGGVPAPALPVDDVTRSAAGDARQAGFQQGVGAIQRDAITVTQADQLAAVTEQQGARLGQSAQDMAEAEARAAAGREAGLAAVGPQMDESVGQARTAIAQAKEALEDEARAIPLGMANVSATDTGEALSAAARAEKLRVDREIINPAYARAFEAAGDVPAALPQTAAAVRSVLGSNTAALSSETAPQTLKAMATFGMTPEQVAAAATGEGVPIGRATLRQINDARVAINADYARAKGLQDPIRGQTLNHLTAIKAALDADLAASSIPQAGKDLYADAIQLWRQHSLPRFRTGNVSTKLFQTTIRNTPAITPSGVAPAFLRNEDTAREFVRLYTDADGVVNQGATAAMRDGVEDAFRGTVSRRTGIDVTSADTWLRKHDKQLDVLEEAMPGLRARLEGYVDAQRRVTMTAKELDATLKSIPREAQAEAKAAAQAIEDAAKQETALARVVREQRDAAIKSEAANASAEVRARADSRLNVLSVRERRLKADADEAKRIAALLTFKSEDDMAAKVLNNTEVRDQVIQRSGRNARAALAQRAEWDANNAGDGVKRMAFIDKNEDALTALFRADDPTTAAQRLAGLRTAAQEAIANETGQSAGRTAEAAMKTRMGAARDAIKETPVEGESLRLYRESRDRLTQGFSDEEMRSLEALELDIARQNRVIEQAKHADPNVSDIEVATRIAGSHGVMDFASRLWTITKHILKIGRRNLSEAQAKQLAQIMLDPNVTADAIEAAVAQRAGNAAVRAAATSAGRAGAVGAAQQGANNQ